MSKHIHEMTHDELMSEIDKEIGATEARIELIKHVQHLNDVSLAHAAELRDAARKLNSQ